ncbi:MAG: transporter substrate-binding domain-containing protein [Psychromonas sp.]
MKLFFRKCSVACFLVFSVPAFAVDISKNITVNFVTEANYYPFEYLNDLNQIQGFDIDIAKAVCEKANLTCQFSNKSFDSLLLTLQFGQFDAVIAALDITEERKLKVDFSNSYYQSAPVFVSAIKESEAFSLDGKFIGVLSKSSNHLYLIKHAKKSSFIISYPSFLKAFSDLSSGTIELVFADQAVVAELLLENDNALKFSVIQTEKIFLDSFSSGYGIAVKKGNVALLERINYGLEKIDEDGTYQAIFKGYFGH